ncbi:TetR/AcrR family transcriptional regulator [Saccharopolyspora sp. K220]|uniref:TetR/AcrR family transcriptional regulator n=1 Tax=Saccharopolyspora soli TaxID=2926618 RepID=UPI001F56AD58|nr:TetR/AcrR family transcriptional regulator [Saccharopolyspora soli]MCI2420993.1 TetR/AcrR family transcriptional regulator [Saccharopolyspora soli]
MRTVNPEQHARKRAKILAAAAGEFATNGVDGTSTAGICRRAGIGSGTLFHYFDSKRAIFHALFSDDVARNAEICARALDTTPASAGLDLLVEHFAADLANPLTPGLAAAAVLQANRDVEFARLLIADAERTHHTLSTLLTRMADEGHQLALPARRAARWIQQLIDTSYLMSDGPEFDPAVQYRELRQVIAWLTGRDQRSTRPGE